MMSRGTHFGARLEEAGTSVQVDWTELFAAAVLDVDADCCEGHGRKTLYEVASAADAGQGGRTGRPRIIAFCAKVQAEAANALGRTRTPHELCPRARRGPGPEMLSGTRNLSVNKPKEVSGCEALETAPRGNGLSHGPKPRG